MRSHFRQVFVGGVAIVTEHGKLEQCRVIPIIGVLRRLAAHRIRHDRKDARLAGVGLVLLLHQGQRVDARVSVTPVGFKTLQVCIDGSPQEAARLGTAGFLRFAPPVLIDAAEQPVGLARRTELGDDLLEHRLGIVETLDPIEREAELLADHLRALQRRRHALIQLDHRPVGFDVAQREIKVDDDAGFDVVEVFQRRLGGDLLDRLGAGAHRVGKPLLVAFRIIDLLAKHVGLGMIDLPMRQHIDQLKDRTVVMRLMPRRRQM